MKNKGGYPVLIQSELSFVRYFGTSLLSVIAFNKSTYKKAIFNAKQFLWPNVGSAYQIKMNLMPWCYISPNISYERLSVKPTSALVIPI